ncbi:hypothetical protein QTP88_029909 [Uroleucon formosanum]
MVSVLMFGVRSTPSAVRPASFVRVVTCHAFNVRSGFLVCAALPLCRVVLFSACGRILTASRKSVFAGRTSTCFVHVRKRSVPTPSCINCRCEYQNILLSVHVTASIALAVGIRSCVLWFDVVSYGTLVRAAPIR